MDNPPKLLFDECLALPLVGQLRELCDILQVDAVLQHVNVLRFEGLNDDVWIPRIADERWIIITQDRGKQQKSSKGAKLPLVCAELRVTHVVLSNKLSQANQLTKYQIIASRFSDILALRDVPPGCGYLLRRTTSGQSKLERFFEPPAEPKKDVLFE